MTTPTLGPMVTSPKGGGQPWWHLDAANLVTIWLILLFLIPQQWVFQAGGSIARPSIVVGLGCALLYAVSRMVGWMVPPGRTPVVAGFWVYGTIVVMSFMLSFNRDLLNSEITAGQREVVMTASMVGVGLLVGASISDRQRLETVLRRVVILGSIVAVVALVQFYLRYDIIAKIKYPGLRLNGGELARSRARSGFDRATGTTAHAIELGILMAMILPLAIHYALHEPVKKRAARYWLMVFLIAATLPATVSRSAILAILISFGILVSVWSHRTLINGAAVGVAGLIVIYASSPTLLGSILALFRGLEDDTSISARTDDYEIAFDFIAERPWFGRGAGTWGSDTYLLLDNQILLSLLEIGWIGVIGLTFMFLLGAFVARSVRHHAPDNTTRHLGQVLFGSILAGYVSMYFVNGLFYQIYVGVCFVFIGAAGGIHRMMNDQPAPPEVEALAERRGLLSRRHAKTGKPRWWAVAVADDVSDLFEDRSG